MFKLNINDMAIVNGGISNGKEFRRIMKKLSEKIKHNEQEEQKKKENSNSVC